MTIAVLSPQDCLPNRLKTKPIPRSTRSHQPKSRKRSPNSSPPPKKPNQLVMGQVRILKRGEAAPFEENGPVLDQALVKPVEPVEIRVEKQNQGNLFYAGSAFVTSPPPSSLPLPAFIKKSVAEIVDVDSSSNLMKMLGINLL